MPASVGGMPGKGHFCPVITKVNVGHALLYLGERLVSLPKDLGTFIREHGITISLSCQEHFK